MNKLSIMLNKQVLLALGAIIFVGAVVASGTGAFFSSSATNTANVFTAGSLVLKMAHSENGTYESTKSAAWTFTNMVPGGTPEEDSIWLKNTGSIDGMTLGVDLDNASASVPGTAAQMRITKMTLGGNSLLEGGAGASITEYMEPATCTVTATPGNLVTTVGSAVAGSIVCLDTGSYNPGTLSISADNITLVGKHDPSGSNAANITGTISVTGDGVTVRGLNITNPSAGYGISVTGGADGLTFADNVIYGIGTSLSEGSAQAISIQNGAAGGTGYSIVNNHLYNIGNTSLIKGAGSGSSAKGIYLGDTSASTNALDDVTIENNIIHDVFASTAPWNGNLGGRGAYGVLTNVKGGVTNLVVKNNSIYNLDGLWSHAIGLEGLTTGASVTYNNIYNLVNHKVENDSVAVMVEDNTGAGIVIQNNNLLAAFGVVHATVGGASVNAKKNWWGDFDPSDQVYTVGPNIKTGDFAGGPIAGFVNGNDWNSNGYADLQDLNNDPILNAGVGLDAGEKKLFIMAVQLDGPTTSNNFQGASLTTDVVFTLNQI